MIYRDMYPMKNMRVRECPYCHSRKFVNRYEDCANCGKSRRNLCITEGVMHSNDGNARYCEICGAKTVFFQAGLLKPWDYADDTISVTPSGTEKTGLDTEELPF